MIYNHIVLTQFYQGFPIAHILNRYSHTFILLFTENILL